jgi:endoglucanase
VLGKKELDGVICCMPPHLSDGNEDKAIEPDKVWIDLGMPLDAVKEVVSVGDTATFISNPKSLLNDRISAIALDNRAGVASLIKVCDIISNCNLDCKVVVVLSCQEETYATGAKTKSFEYEPDECICVDVSFANQDGVSDSYSKIELGKGPMLCYSSTLNKNMTNKLSSIAKSLDIPTQVEVCAGRTGTNADHITTSKSGVKSTVLSIPLRNMHTQVEIVDINDIENTAKLIAQYIISGGIQ